MAIKTEIVWHKASEELPEKSGFYAIANVNMDGNIYSLANVIYSAVHERFNCADCFTKKMVDKCSMTVSFWAELPEFPEVSNG